MLSSLQIRGFRGFSTLEIDPLGRVNLLVGRNNVGKTTVLEAVQLFAAGTAAVVPAMSILESRDELARTGTETRFDTVRLFHRPKAAEPSKEFRIGPVHGDALIGRLGWGRWVPYEDGTPKRVMIEGTPTEASEEYEQLLDFEYGEQRRRALLSQLYRYRPGRPDLDTPREPSCFLGARGLAEDGASRLWDSIALTDAEEHVIEALRLIDGDLEAVTFVAPARGSASGRDRIPLAKRRGRPAEPLRSLGDGMNRLFELALGLVSAQGGYFLVDEPENGIHYSVQPAVWRVVFETATRLGVQVFAATHSWDCIEAFQQAASAHPAEGVLVRLERRGEEIAAVTFTEEELAIATRESIELR